MKYFISFFMVVFASLGIVMWTSCDKQLCDPATCVGNNMGCVQGQCGCLQGFEGPNCDTYSFEKYVGNYIVSETCNSGSTGGGTQQNQYNMFISSGFSIDRIVINSFMGIGSIEAVINNNNVAIPSQDVGATTVEGIGEFFPQMRQLRLEYQFFRGNQSGQCTATMTKL